MYNWEAFSYPMHACMHGACREGHVQPASLSSPFLFQIFFLQYFTCYHIWNFILLWQYFIILHMLFIKNNHSHNQLHDQSCNQSCIGDLGDFISWRRSFWLRKLNGLRASFAHFHHMPMTDTLLTPLTLALHLGKFTLLGLVSSSSTLTNTLSATSPWCT